MGWHYQVMRHKTNEEEWYEMHEYFPLESGHFWSESGSMVVGLSIEDIKWQLKAMLNDLEKHGVKDYTDE